MDKEMKVWGTDLPPGESEAGTAEGEESKWTGLGQRQMRAVMSGSLWCTTRQEKGFEFVRCIFSSIVMYS